MPTIWGKNKRTGIVEKVDSCSESESAYLCGEYQLAFGRDWIVWAGLKRDEPKGETEHNRYAEEHRYKGGR